MKIERIMPGMGIRSNLGTLGAAGLTLIRDDVNVLVDVGHFGMRDMVLSAFEKRKLKPEDIDVVVLTHIHWDHCLNVDLFNGAKIVVGEEELEEGSLTYPDPPLTSAFKTVLKRMKVETVRDGARISKHCTALSTPGHSPGHIAVLIKEGEGRPIIVSGDAVPNYRAYLRGFPDLSFYDKTKARKSVQRIKELDPKVIIPGHDGPFNKDGYIERDDFTLILRRENEENSLVTLSHVPADKPVIYRWNETPSCGRQFGTPGLDRYLSAGR